MTLCKFIEADGELRCEQCGAIVPMRSVPVYRKCVKQTARMQSRTLPEVSACNHRGNLLRVEKCKPCQTGGITPEIYACPIHGECTLYTISKRKPDGSRWQACSTCEQRQEASVENRQIKESRKVQYERGGFVEKVIYSKSQ